MKCQKWDFFQHMFWNISFFQNLTDIIIFVLTITQYSVKYYYLCLLCPTTRVLLLDRTSYTNNTKFTSSKHIEIPRVIYNNLHPSIVLMMSKLYLSTRLLFPAKHNRLLLFLFLLFSNRHYLLKMCFLSDNFTRCLT